MHQKNISTHLYTNAHRMYGSIFSSRIQIGIALIMVLLFSACPPIDHEYYPVDNPIMLAFRHQINLDSLRLSVAKDTSLNIVSTDDGIQFFGQNDSYDAEYQLWLNDSLLVVNITGICCAEQGLSGTSNTVLHKKSLRNTRAYLLKNFPTHLATTYLYNHDLSTLNRFAVRSQYKIRPFASLAFTPVDSLIWIGDAFGTQNTMRFKNSILQGSFSIRDTTRQLLINGIFDQGMETGDWQYFDFSGKLQWTETYEHGELQEIIYADGAQMSRKKRLPTIKELTRIHRFLFFVFMALLIFTLKYLIRSHKGFHVPYSEMKALTIFKHFLLSLLIGLATAFICIVFFLLSISLLNAIFDWTPLPDGLGILLACIFCLFLIGMINYLLTFRLQDILWIPFLTTITLLLYFEYHFLESLGTGIF